MPDLLPGSTVNGLDTPPTVTNTQNDLFTFNATTFGVDADSGVYVDCGVAFTAPTTGRVKIDYGAELDNDTAAAATACAPVVRTAGVVGSGTIVVSGDNANAVRNIGTDARRFGAHITVTGLTAGTTYNVRLEHRVSGGIGTIQYRNVTVVPCT